MLAPVNKKMGEIMKNGKITVQMDIDDFLERMRERLVEYHELDNCEVNLYMSYFEGLADGGAFDGTEYSPEEIVDDIVINWTETVCDGDSEFPELLEAYEDEGNCVGFSYEGAECVAVDSETAPSMFLLHH